MRAEPLARRVAGLRPIDSLSFNGATVFSGSSGAGKVEERASDGPLVRSLGLDFRLG